LAQFVTTALARPQVDETIMWTTVQQPTTWIHGSLYLHLIPSAVKGHVYNSLPFEFSYLRLLTAEEGMAFQLLGFMVASNVAEHLVIVWIHSAVGHPGSQELSH